MKQIQLSFEQEATNYCVHIEQGSLRLLPSIVFPAAIPLNPAAILSIPAASPTSDKKPKAAGRKRVVILADARVFALYGAQVSESFRQAGHEVISSTFEASETTKSLDTVASFYDELLTHRIERTTAIVALGGGIAGDVVGFVAASYLRGVPFFQVPTTLLAMVDASVGGKVGVNLPQGKNLVGAFYQPQAVIIDPLVLSSLQEREFRSGLAECVKHAIIADADLFDWTLKNSAAILRRDAAVLEELIHRNVSIKARIVMSDEKERGERALLNLGHTFAHAIESSTNYSAFLHGEAVSLGIVAAAELASHTGDAGEPNASAEMRTRIQGLLTDLGLPIRAELPAAEKLLDAMKLDKKVEDGTIKFVIPEKIGSAKTKRGIPEEAVRHAWKAISTN